MNSPDNNIKFIFSTQFGVLLPHAPEAEELQGGGHPQIQVRKLFPDECYRINHFDGARLCGQDRACSKQTLARHLHPEPGPKQLRQLRRTSYLVQKVQSKSGIKLRFNLKNEIS